MVIGVGAALGAALLFGVAAAVQAVAVRRTRLLAPMMGWVALAYLLGWMMHLVAISRLPLYVAQIAIAGSLVVTTLIAAHVVHEPLAARHWVAVAAVVGGVGLLVTASGGMGSNLFDQERTLTLYVAVVVTLLLGLGAARLRGERSGLVLGVLGGIAYAGSPIATRSLVDPAWDWETVAPAITIGLFGLLGFWLYSLALQRTSVTAATAPLVLLETLVPAAVGVLVFGDQVRPGLAPLALTGFLLSTLGALVLCGAESRLEHIEEHHHDPRPDRPLDVRTDHQPV